MAKKAIDLVPDVYILGAGGTGRELKELIILAPNLNFVGFLDDKDKPDVVGSLSDWINFSGRDRKFISALGSFKSMVWRRKTLESINLESFYTFLDSKSVAYPSVTLGRGVVVFPYAVLTANSFIGNHCLIYHHATVAHDCQIGDFSIVSNNATISGGVTIGTNTYVGAGATITEGVNVGKNCIVGAGATVVRSIRDGSIFISNKKNYNNHYLNSP